MKRKLFIIMLALTGFASACKNSTDDPLPSGGNTQTPEEIANLITGSSWKVSYYFDNGKDETSDYSEYTFQFNSNNAFVATGSSSSFNGTWQINNSGDDNPTQQRFTIQITGNDAMDKLSDDWVKITITKDLIDLKDDKTTEPEYLKFSKI